MSSAPQVMRVVLMGKTGAGKSSIGNTLLGRDDFLAELGFSSVTFKCRWAEAHRFDTLLQVTDTPGVADTETSRSEDEVLKEVSKSIAVASPGPHVILMILRCDVRFTKGEYDAYLTLKKLFDENIRNYMIVVFTRIDTYGGPQESEKSLAKAIQSAPETLTKVLNDAGGRYCAVNNNAPRAERDQQARTIMSAMKNLVAQNRNAYFTSQLCEEVSKQVETVVQHRMETSHGALTHEVAVRETRQDIVAQRVEPSFMKKLLKTVGDAILPVIAYFVGAVAEKAANAALKKCSVM